MAANPNWTPVEALSFAPPGSEQVAVAAAGDTLHLVWVLSKTLYHSRLSNGAWQTPVKIAAGEQPVLGAAPDGGLYCAYANWFLGNRDIYLAAWSSGKWGLSQVISHTSGESSDPAICVAPDGVPHLAWADNTPGYSVIYHGLREPGGWAYGPIPNGKGSRPSITASGSAIYAAWQDRLAASKNGAFEALAAVKRAGEWTLPAMVSDSPEVHSLVPQIAANSGDRCHMLWQEERDDVHVIRHSDLWPNGWEAPVDVSDPAADARLGLVLPNRLGQFQFIWSEGAMIKHRVRPGEPQGAWWDTEIACEDCAGLSQLAATISASGELHLVFTRWVNGGAGRQLFYLKRKALERKKVIQPAVQG